jgi:hypothetical protein
VNCIDVDLLGSDLADDARFFFFLLERKDMAVIVGVLGVLPDDFIQMFSGILLRKFSLTSYFDPPAGIIRSITKRVTLGFAGIFFPFWRSRVVLVRAKPLARTS